MPRVNRNEIFADDEIQVFHLVNRCVRRTFLCGKDDLTGRDFSHRKQWVRDRMEELAGIFGVEVLGFAVMCNHLHIVARTRPDIVRGWSDEEVALRWWNLFPQRRRKDKTPEEPTEFELNHIRNDVSGMKEKRRRLSNVSWFMKCLAEPIARLGNKEEKVTGHFWEGRFKAPRMRRPAALGRLARHDASANAGRFAREHRPRSHNGSRPRLAAHRAAHQPTGTLAGEFQQPQRQLGVAANRHRGAVADRAPCVMSDPRTTSSPRSWSARSA